MTQVLETKDIYREDFEAIDIPFREPVWLRDAREEALASVTRLGFPTLKEEAWRFTNVAPIAQTPFRLASRTVSPAELLRGSVLPDAHRMVFVNGFYSSELSDTGALPRGGMVASLAEMLERDPGVVEPYLARQADYRSHAFTALNTAFLSDGAFVFVPKGQVLDRPVQLIFLSLPGADPTVSYPRVLIVLGENSQATVVETYLGMGESSYFTNAVTEVVLEANAILDHYKLQREGAQGYHIAALRVAQSRSSSFSHLTLDQGGTLARNEAGVVLDGDGGTCTLNGLSLASGRQLVDNHTHIDHRTPHCNSSELYKAILDGHGHVVFSGRIHVHPDAQKTDARQTSQTLLLSQDAIINTQPQLEIYADDVKCTHGATVGQLDAEALFYLRSRGIGLKEARALLVRAFANEIIDRIRLTSLREQCEAILSAACPTGGREG